MSCSSEYFTTTSAAPAEKAASAQARAKKAFSGELQQLPGIGPHTARLLWEHFDSVADMKKASLDNLLALPGIGRKKAEAIWNALKNL